MIRDSAEVVIIGAGAAGLMAGRLLAEAGKHVIVVEARDRIGGRIFTRHTRPTAGTPQDSVPIELGAEFIHGLPPASWSCIEEAKLATIELGGRPFCFDGRQLELCEERQRVAFKVLADMETWIDRRTPGSDVTFDGYLRSAGVSGADAQRASAYVEGFNAADRNLASATALVRQQRAEEQMQAERIFHLTSGYDTLPNYLAERLSQAGGRILLESPVKEIRWTRGSVTVRGRTADNGEFMVEAPQAVITLPLGVLQANAVTFSPAPGDLPRQWRFLVMGRAERISLLFDRTFWNDRAPEIGFLFSPHEIIPTWWTAAPQPISIITGWAAGTQSMARWQQAGVFNPAALKSAALQSLAKIFTIPEGQLRRWLIGAHHHDWQADEYSRGAYSYVGLGGLDASRIMSSPVSETLFFAGEHTDIDDQWGTVHAALASGMRAARQMLELPPRR